MGILDKMLLFASGKKANDLPSPPDEIQLKKILIVEADEVLKTQYTELIPKEEFNVLAVVNGAEGLNALLTFQPDAVLLDLDLPIMNGKEMLGHMRAIPEYKFTPVLAVSETGDIDTIQQVKVYDGAKALLIKSTVTPKQTIDTLLGLI